MNLIGNGLFSFVVFTVLTKVLLPQIWHFPVMYSALFLCPMIFLISFIGCSFLQWLHHASNSCFSSIISGQPVPKVCLPARLIHRLVRAVWSLRSLSRASADWLIFLERKRAPRKGCGKPSWKTLRVYHNALRTSSLTVRCLRIDWYARFAHWAAQARIDWFSWKGKEPHERDVESHRGKRFAFTTTPYAHPGALRAQVSYRRGFLPGAFMAYRCPLGSRHRMQVEMSTTGTELYATNRCITFRSQFLHDRCQTFIGTKPRNHRRWWGFQ